jgi:hypothetical protein
MSVKHDKHDTSAARALEMGKTASWLFVLAATVVIWAAYVMQIRSFNPFY